MHIGKILKIFMVNAVLFPLLFTISFMAACGRAVTTDKVIEKEVEEVAAGEEEEAVAERIKIESTAFKDNEMIPADYTCDGSDINPQLIISGIPADAKSLVLIVEDRDAPAGTWIHWTVWNIDPAATEIPENSVPFGAVEGVTDFGEPGYRGPCPPSGTHHYFFKLYALDTDLGLSASATVQDIEEAMDGHMIDSAELVGLYKR
jgi:Raf kinase inhibitor-like YbhB/YbcL family protein